MRRAIATVPVLLAVAAPATARAQQPAAEPASPAAAAPAVAQLSLKLERIGGLRATTLTGSRIRIRGRTDAYVPGQLVTVRVYVGGRKLYVRRMTLRPGPGGGVFALSYRPPRTGTLRVHASHAATAQLGTMSARSVAVDVLPRRVSPDSGRRAVRALQRRLARLGYVVGARGDFDARTARAVLAFRKVTGMARTTRASTDVMRAIARGAGRFRIRRPDLGRHIEADLSRQVIALVERGRVQRIYPVSSGAPSTPTVIGTFRVYRKDPGTNAKGMVHSAYFIRGYATHGYASVPTFPASHGCLRVPIPDALSLFRWIAIGTPVVVYP